MTSRLLVFASLLVAACGRGSPPDVVASDAARHDGPVADARLSYDASPDGTTADAGHLDAGHPDARLIDASRPDARLTDASLPDAPPATAAHHTYVIDCVILPLEPGDSAGYGLDLDGDGTVDNAFGRILEAMGAAGDPFVIQSSLYAQIVKGDILLLVDLQAPDLNAASTATFHMYTGADPQPSPCSDPSDIGTCGRHLVGTGTFDIATDSPTDATMVGPIVGSRLNAGPGKALFAISFFDSAPVTVDLLGARVDMPIDGDAALGIGILAGVIPETEVNDRLLPAVQAGVATTVARDCSSGPPPTCGCTSSSMGAIVIKLFDANHDCQVSTDEVRQNDLVKALLAPDLTIDGQPGLSAGVEVTAIAGKFTAP